MSPKVRVRRSVVKVAGQAGTASTPPLVARVRRHVTHASTPLVEVVLSRLEGVTSAGEGKYQARCPAHEDAKPSLSVSTGDGRRVLLHCHAGCSLEEVVAAINMRTADLFPNAQKGRHIAALYDYTDAQGSLLFQVVRYEPKDFRQRRPDGHGNWIPNLKGVRPVLYNLPAVHAADKVEWVFVVEGEKDAESLRRIGLTATTCPMGAGKWSRVDDSPLHGRRVAVLPDNDEPGKAHGQQVAASLHGKAAELKIVELPGLPPKGDVSDWLQAGGTRDALLALVKSAPDATVSAPDEPEHGGFGIIRQSFADIEPEEVTWLWYARIPQGKLTLLVGDPGVGKSYLTMDIAARISLGADWPDLPGKRSAPGSVIVLSAEDDPADTIRPRLDALRADIDRVSVIRGVRRDEGEGADLFSLEEDLAALDAELRVASDVRLVIVDPISAYMGATDSHKNSDVRGLLARLADVAARRQVAILAVSHLNKDQGGCALYRAMGSLAFTAAPRAVHLVAKEEDSDRRLFLPAKLNLAVMPSGIAYRIVNGRLQWDTAPVTVTADELCRRLAVPETGVTAFDEAQEWLAHALEDGPKSAEEVLQDAKDEGVSRATLGRAKRALGVKTRKEGFGKDGSWVWELPKTR